MALTQLACNFCVLLAEKLAYLCFLIIKMQKTDFTCVVVVKKLQKNLISMHIYARILFYLRFLNIVAQVKLSFCTIINLNVLFVNLNASKTSFLQIILII